MTAATTQTEPLRVAVYCRISQDRNDRSESPERQEAMCRALIESKGWTVANVFVDRDTSAYKKRVKRPGLEALWEGLENGHFDGVCVWKLDRLTRRFVDAGPILSRLEDHGAKLLSVVDSIDTSTPMGKAIVGVLIAQAETESLNTSLRVTAVRESEAIQGKPHGGRRCFGYTQDRTHHPVEYLIAREIVDRILAGKSLRSTVRWLDESGIRTASGKPWGPVVLKQWLRAPAIAGIRTHNGTETPGNWPGIITTDEREALLLRLGTTRPSGQPAVIKNLLAGFVVCGNCGSKLYVQHSGGVERHGSGSGRYRYSCKKAPGKVACGKVFIAQASLDATVVERLISFLINVDRRPIEGDRDILSLRRALKDDESALLDLGRQRFVRQNLDDAQYQALSQELREHIEATRGTLAAWEQSDLADIPTGDREAVENWWAEASMDVRRSALRQSVTEVIVNPATVRGNKFDPRRVGVLFNLEGPFNLGGGLGMDRWGNVYGLEIKPANGDSVPFVMTPELQAAYERWRQ